jgi:transposase
MKVAGIDVGSEQLHVEIRHGQDGRCAARPPVFTNDHEGIAKLIKMLHKRGVARVVLEATGVYHLDLALALDQAKGMKVMVLNPKAAKAYADVQMRRAKTDPIDTALLADYAQHMSFEAWCAPRPQILALRACSRRLVALTRLRTQAKNQLHALQATASTPAFIIEDARLSVTQLDAQIAALQANTLAMIAADESLQATFELLLSITGVGAKSAIQLMGELLVLDTSMRAKQWVAMAGLDPRPYKSGSSVDKRPRISKVGNRYLRSALYMPALSASRHVPEVKAYYQHLIEDRHLRKIQAVCAVMRKLLHAIHGMLKTGECFDASRFYTSASADA